MIYRREQNCLFCKHYMEKQTCLAFPAGIPDELWTGENLHEQPYPDDQGYRHEQKFMEFPALTPDQVAALHNL